MTTLAFLLLLALFFVALGRSTAGADRPPLRVRDLPGAVARGVAELSRLHASGQPVWLGGTRPEERRSGRMPGQRDGSATRAPERVGRR